MRANTRTFVTASDFAILHVAATKKTFKVYLCVTDKDYKYYVTSFDNDVPDDSVLFGEFYWDGTKVQWKKSNADNEFN